MYGSEPTWAPDAHLDRVYRRGRQLRRRRRLAGLLGPTLAVVAVVGGVMAFGSNTAQRRVDTVAQPHTTTSLAAEPGPDAGQPAADGGDQSQTPPTSTAPSVSNGASGSPSRKSSGAVVAPTGPGPNSAGAQNQAAAPTSTTTTAPVGPCGASDLDYSTSTDRTSYAPGRAVTVSMVVHNHSSHPCDGPGFCGISPWASVQNAAGTQVWRSNAIAIACTNPPPAPPRLAPGASYSYAAGTWDQQVCDSTSGSCSGQAPAGTYRAIAHRGNTTAKSARFDLTG
jgi:hypothetical protein